MTNVAIIESEKKKKPPTNPLKKKFENLQKQIKSLEQKYKDDVALMDQHLTFYQQSLQPLHSELCTHLKDQIKIIYSHANDKKMFNKHEKRSVFNVLSNLFVEITTKSNSLGLEDDLSTIFKEVEGISYKEVMSNGFSDIKEMVEEMFAQKGVDIDLTDFDLTGSQEDILNRLFDKMHEQKSFFDQEDTEPEIKSQKELELELKEQQIDNLQKKGMNSLYKQLAKAFHPDLEKDPEQKIEKEILMKKLTSAYEENDLHTLLSLEIYWLSKSDTPKKDVDPDQLKQYNKILSDQVMKLKYEIESISSNPKYFVLHSYDRGSLEYLGLSLSKDFKASQKKLSTNKKLTEQLQSSQAKEIIRNMIRKQRKLEEECFYF